MTGESFSCGGLAPLSQICHLREDNSDEIKVVGPGIWKT